MVSPIPDSRPLPPVIILIRPQLGENIGAVARAMSNFGLKELRIVAPRDGWPNPRAGETASGGEYIVKAAKLYKDFPSALEGVHVAYATTARPRDMEKPVMEPPVAAKDMIKHAAGSSRVAIVFGPERTGMENDEVALCDTLITIPTAPENSSLNLGQSAVVLGYEWWKQSGMAHKGPALEPSAPKEEYNGLFDQLEAYLDEANFFRVDHKKPIMWQNLRTALLRGRFTSQEIQTLRGMLRVLWEGRKPRKER